MKKPYDSSYSKHSMEAALRKGDFFAIPPADHEAFRKKITLAAENEAYSLFQGINPIDKFHLKKKDAYRISSLPADLVLRKLGHNLKRHDRSPIGNRKGLVTNLRCFLDEGVPYRVYRLDVKSFYESFIHMDILKTLFDLERISPIDKKLLNELFRHFSSLGGKGLPRGMAISAPISNLCMRHFDETIFNQPYVYFYGRYVDDMVIVTNSHECPNDFKLLIENNLPTGLQLNSKKTNFINVCEAVNPGKSPPGEQAKKIVYLGYQFLISPEKTDSSRESSRSVRVEIAPEKIKKIKTRIVKSLHAFKSTGDFNLLLERIQYLTSNFSVIDLNTGKKQLAGIFFSYPNLSRNAKSLNDLDAFLRHAISSRSTRFLKGVPKFTAIQKRKLLTLSFKSGYECKRFIYFHPAKINRIQGCWKYV